MAKQGMKRPDETHDSRRLKSGPAVPELQGKQKNSKEKANPIIEGSGKSPDIKVYHHKPISSDKKKKSAYPAIDNDLARDNLQNDIPEADLQDLK